MSKGKDFKFLGTMGGIHIDDWSLTLWGWIEGADSWMPICHGNDVNEMVDYYEGRVTADERIVSVFAISPRPGKDWKPEGLMIIRIGDNPLPLVVI